MNKDIDIELPERTEEVIKKGNDFKIKEYVTCGPCMNNRHQDCNLEECRCKRDNHKETS